MSIDKEKKDLKEYVELGELFNEKTKEFLDNYEMLFENEIKELKNDKEFINLMARLDQIEERSKII